MEVTWARSWRPDSQVSQCRFWPDSLFVEVKTEKYNGRLYSADLITSWNGIAVVLTRAFESDPSGFPFFCLSLKSFWHLGFLYVFKSYLSLSCTKSIYFIYLSLFIYAPSLVASSWTLFLILLLHAWNFRSSLCCVSAGLSWLKITSKNKLDPIFYSKGFLIGFGCRFHLKWSLPPLYIHIYIYTCLILLQFLHLFMCNPGLHAYQ